MKKKPYIISKNTYICRTYRQGKTVRQIAKAVEMPIFEVQQIIDINEVQQTKRVRTCRCCNKIFKTFFKHSKKCNACKRKDDKDC